MAAILGADRLRTEAANALLKTLEEPRPRVALLLVADRSEALPKTLRSRTAELRFAREPEAAVRARLAAEGVEPEDAWLAAELGGGGLEAARRFAADEVGGARDLARALERLRSASASDVLDFAEEFRGAGVEARGRVELFLAVHAAVVRRALEAAVAAGEHGRARRWLDQFDAGERARRELVRRNLNPQMLVEGLLIEFRAASG